MKRFLNAVFICCCTGLLTLTPGLLRAGQTIRQIRVEGNAKVESDAILNLLSSQKGKSLQQSTVREDIHSLYDLGYFSDIRVFREPHQGGVELTIQVKEKPAITKIEFMGMEELKEDDIRKSIETTLYTILNEGSIAADMRLIEKKYTEKGYYLALVTYTIEEKGKNEVELTFHVDERGKVLVGDVHILGNTYFSDGDITEKLASRPYTRWAATLGAPSMYQDEFVKRDLEFLAYYYKDQGFADVSVRKPVIQMDPDKQFVRITFELEEGLQYRVGSVRVTGDVGEGLYTESELVEAMKLKPENLFRYSRFSRDIELLVDRYGDLGYAYVDVNPKTSFDKEKQVVHINYEITKGQKVYFGEMNIIGNTKTRDNVIRRELAVHDSELYSGTRLAESKKNINRLGYFEEVQVIKERDEEVDNLLNLKFRVKEKATGQLQAALGYSPGGKSKASFFGQGKYDEKNQSGKGWNTSLTGKYGGANNWELDLGFADPRVNDSEWSLGFNVGYKIQETVYVTGAEIPTNDQSISVRVGRSLFELVRAFTTLKHSEIYELEERNDVYISESQKATGVKNSLTIGLSRRELDNYLDPTEGTDVSVYHTFTGGLLQGSYEYWESTADADYYIPLDFSETFRTYFKIKGVISKLWPVKGKEIPSVEKYRLGFYDLRGYPYGSVGAKSRRITGPHSSGMDYNVGGDKKLYFQFEYFVPLIPQAGIKALIFADMGDVYRESENYKLSFRDFKKDVGFGFRWLTPIAPFRFEWAYPYDNEKKEFGDMEFIFNIGF